MVRGWLHLGKENLGGAADEIAALRGEASLAAGHLIPDAAEGVVGEELDDVAGSEELIADGEFSGVARGGRLLAHLLALCGRVEVLIHPPDGLVLTPKRFHVTCIKQFQQL